MKIKVILTLLVMAVGTLILMGCAASSNEMANTAVAGGEVAGFWLGLWHGAILFFTFIISFFNKNVGIYEIHNDGTWYNLGFLLGVSIAFGGSGSGASRSRRNREC